MAQHTLKFPKQRPSPYKLTPGVRMLLRDAEWRVERTEHLDNRLGLLIYARGISGLVRDKEALFVERFERVGDIQVIDPKETRLVADSSSNFQAGRLYLEGQLRHATPLTDDLAIAQLAPIDQLPYQFVPAQIALRARRARLLIADDVGLGKTLKAGIIAAELIARGRGRRILAVTKKNQKL